MLSELSDLVHDYITAVDIPMGKADTLLPPVVKINLEKILVDISNSLVTGDWQPARNTYIELLRLYGTWTTTVMSLKLSGMDPNRPEIRGFEESISAYDQVLNEIEQVMKELEGE